MTPPGTPCRTTEGLARVRCLLLALIVLLGLPACGFDAQTLQPYTPAMGVNADAGEDSILKVRNLLLVSRTPGQGFVSASIISKRPEALVGVSGTTILTDRTEGAPLQATVTNPVELAPNDLVVLTDRPLILVRSPDLRAGGMARVVLEFREAGSIEMLVPVYRDQNELETISPSVPAPLGT